MNKNCECPMAGFCSRHQMQKGPELFARCRGTSSTPCESQIARWEAWEKGKAGAGIAQENPILNPSGYCSEVPVEITEYKSSVGDKLAGIIKRETGKDIPCVECAKDIYKLNSMTVEECRQVKRKYVDNIYSRSFKFASPLERVELKVDRFLHTGIAEATIGKWFDEAVDIGGEPKKVKPVVENEEIIRLRELAARAVAAKPKRNTFIGEPQLKPTKEQNVSYNDIMTANKPTEKPFIGDIVFNLIYHLWPVKGVWEWHVEKINDLIKTINGKVIIGIVEDETTSTLDEIKSLITHDNIIWIQNKNISECGNLSLRGKPFGEVSTFEQALPLIKDTGDSITIYAHAKGIRQHTRDCEAVRLWTEMMYETVSFAKHETIKAMEKGYDFFGSFRTFGFRPFIPKYHWHYSGTFFNFRTQSVFTKGVQNVQQVYGGVEAWPGDMCPATHSYCSFEDNSPWLRQYSLGLMYPHVVDRQMQWEVDRIGPIRCEQHKRELDWFINNLLPSDKVLIIGSKHGGLECALKKALPNITTISIDINPQSDNDQQMIIGSSADLNVQKNATNNGPFDVVFIDGDHSYNGVKIDWEFSKTLNPRIIAFHDIAKAVKHRKEGCDVDQLWYEIKNHGYNTAEKIVGCGWGGVGIVWMK